MNHRGTEFSHDDAGGLVGKLDCFCKTRAPCEHHAQHCNYRVARTAYIVHFPRNGGNVKALAFAVGGKHVFARVIHHPGSRFPARPYLASALSDEADEIAAALKLAAITAAQEAIG